MNELAENRLRFTPTRGVLHYAIGVIIFTLYGARVCPFLDTLPPTVLFIQTATLFIVLFFIRQLNHAAKHKEMSLTSSIGFFTFAGICLAAWYNALYSFPLDSNLKVIFGFTLLGIVISLDLSISSLRHEAPKTSDTLIKPENVVPLAKQAGLGAMLLVIMVTVLLGLVVTKDLLWLVEHTEHKPAIADIDSILKEFVYVSFIVLAYIAVITQNGIALIHQQLQKQIQSMTLASNGDFSGQLPSNHTGELGVVAYYTNVMLRELQTSYDEINKARDATIIGLSTLAEVRDNETGAHILRTQCYVKALAEQLRKTPKYADYLSDATIDLLYKSAPLHDVGKVGIPDAILLKPGKLTDDEFEIMKMHAQLGADALSITEKNADGIAFLRFAKEIAATHHEKWDGSGYPQGLVGEDIPLSGRLMALADVYDALISKRVYKPAFSHEKAKSIILEGNGTHFDPAVVEAFLVCEKEFTEIADRYRDRESHAA
ncbi:HD domain-containing protein [Enterovibrio sp. ZSDZ35]|uniref:HD domain-containing protein n=1 Tax=Enterovibrio qingdaonensis TaxID=2899818 RepID=A0ABT5QRW2_9GAMM|nr:HD domain-containing phosphohydrolase [Enterovibrio sp. ZSDZ35]MDD1783731.1 HD domain-containing protein [Enterovibrio sp. ZSDZ35]